MLFLRKKANLFSSCYFPSTHGQPQQISAHSVKRIIICYIQIANLYFNFSVKSLVRI